MATLLLSLFINSTFATTSHNIYDAKGNVIASCTDSGCEYFIYQSVSRVGVVKDNQFSHQSNGIDGKAGEMVHDQSGIINSQLWIPDFHGSVIAKLTNEESDSILFDAFGGVLNEEDCQDYHYTDKPRIGCTDLHNFNARFYDSKIGRFITTDPVEQANLNWFMYANNNPLSFVDPTGQEIEVAYDKLSLLLNDYPTKKMTTSVKIKTWRTIMEIARSRDKDGNFTEAALLIQKYLHDKDKHFVYPFHGGTARVSGNDLLDGSIFFNIDSHEHPDAALYHEFVHHRQAIERRSSLSEDPINDIKNRRAEGEGEATREENNYLCQTGRCYETHEFYDNPLVSVAPVNSCLDITLKHEHSIITMDDPYGGTVEAGGTIKVSEFNP